MEKQSEILEEKNKKEEIPINPNEDKKEKSLNKQEKNIEQQNSEEFELKDYYSIDDISYSKLEMDKDSENSILSHKKRKINNLSKEILDDNLDNLKEIISKNESLIHKKTLEGFNFLQYAALNGSINCFKHLLTLKLKTDEDIEGFHLIHLSIINCLFRKYKGKSLIMFKYIYQNLPEQRKLLDRLGRTYLHLIFEYDFDEALDSINIDLEDLYNEDINGEFAINYIYIFNAERCFIKIAKDYDIMKNIYLATREKFLLNKSINFSKEEKFLENLMIYRNPNIIKSIVMQCPTFIQEFVLDLNSIYNKYYELNLDQSNIFENNDINIILKNIEITLSYLNYLQQHFFGGINEYYELNFPLRKPILKTAIVYNRDCINHIKLPQKDPIKHLKKRNQLFENSDRLSCLINEDNGIILNNQIFFYKEQNNNFFENRYLFIESKRKSCLNDILKCHDIKYIKALKYKIDNIKKNNNKEEEKTPLKFWDDINMDLIEKNYFLNSKDEDTENAINLFKYEKIDIDTFINKYSYENIYNTTGCVLDAIDVVMQGNAINSFALIRPPGHHSGYYGPVENQYGTSNGFCVVNNVAIGAAYAKYKYSEIIKKIAIVDIDVHHGNGTEEIVEMLNYKNFSKPFNYEKICGVKITEKQNINWLDFDDAKNVLFISTHIYDKKNPDKFYPYSGSDEKNTKKDSEIYPAGIYNIPLELKENYPYEYRNILRSKIIPRLYKFKPDIIFISAGFDGHIKEIINQKHMLLQENDYGYIAQQLQFVANKFCNGRMVSVLEGGYNISTGIISSFAQSVFYFTRFMNIGANMLQCHDVKLSSQKRKLQLNEETELYNSMKKPKVLPRRSERLKHLEEERNNKEPKIEENIEENKKENKVDDINKENNKNDNKEGFKEDIKENIKDYVKNDNIDEKNNIKENIEVNKSKNIDDNNINENNNKK